MHEPGRAPSPRPPRVTPPSESRTPSLGPPFMITAATSYDAVRASVRERPRRCRRGLGAAVDERVVVRRHGRLADGHVDRPRSRPFASRAAETSASAADDSSTGVTMPTQSFSTVTSPSCACCERADPASPCRRRPAPTAGGRRDADCRSRAAGRRVRGRRQRRSRTLVTAYAPVSTVTPVVRPRTSPASRPAAADCWRRTDEVLADLERARLRVLTKVHVESCPRRLPVDARCDLVAVHDVVS